MKRKIAALLCSILLFSGCTFLDEDESPAQVGQVRLVVAVENEKEKELLRCWADAFVKENPNVHFVVELQENLTEQADLFTLDVDHYYAQAQRGELYALAKNSADQWGIREELSRFPVYTQCQYGGEIFAVPIYYETTALVYNKALFDEFTVRYPGDSWGLSTFKDVVALMTQQGVYGFAAPNERIHGYENFIYQMSGYTVGGDGAGFQLGTTVSGIHLYLSLRQAGYSPSGEDFTQQRALEMFQEGDIAMMYAGIEQTKAIAEQGMQQDLGVTALPKFNERTAVLDYRLLAISAHSRSSPTAEQFVGYILSKRAGELAVDEHVQIALPVNPKVWDRWAAQYAGADLRPFVQMANGASPIQPSLTRETWSKIQDEVFTQIFAGEEELEVALTSLQKRIAAILATEI